MRTGNISRVRQPAGIRERQRVLFFMPYYQISHRANRQENATQKMYRLQLMTSSKLEVPSNSAKEQSSRAEDRNVILLASASDSLILDIHTTIGKQLKSYGSAA